MMTLRLLELLCKKQVPTTTPPDTRPTRSPYLPMQCLHRHRTTLMDGAECGVVVLTRCAGWMEQSVAWQDVMMRQTSSTASYDLLRHCLVMHPSS